MNSKKTKIIIASLAAALVAGGTLTMAFLTDKTIETENLFQKGKKYTLTYHANTENAANDGKVSGLPEEQTEYGDGTTAVTFTVSTDKPTRPGFVFKKWTEEADKDSTVHAAGSGWTVPVGKFVYDLYAQWEDGYTLIYDPNGGEGTPNITKNTGEEVSGNIVTKETGDSSYTFRNLATQGDMTGPKHKDPDDPEKESDSNRVFLGWSTDPKATVPDYTNDGKLAYPNTQNDYDGDKTDGFETEVKIIAENNPEKTVTLYAVWATKYELRFKYHPDMNKPAHGPENKLQPAMTRVTCNKEHTFNLVTQTEADEKGWTPTREEGYLWGWWGDNLERFKFSKPQDGHTAAQDGNEGCYLFGEPVPARQPGDDPVKAPKYEEPVLTLYAYFQPPSKCSITFEHNTSSFPDSDDRHVYPNKIRVTDFPDNKTASFTQTEWRPNIPDGDENTPKHNRYVFLGWSEDKNSKDPEHQPGDQVYLNKVLNNEMTLYAIWKPMHNFRLTFNRGYKNANNRVDYTGTEEYYVQTSSRQWKNGGYNIWFESNANEYETATNKYFTDKSYTWQAGFFNKRGFFATKKDDTVGTYKFLGWSWEPQTPSTDEDALMETVAFPVKVPEDPASLLDKAPDDSDIGIVKEAITVTEDTPCTRPTTHGEAGRPTAKGYTLYAVYRKSPLHQLRVVFNKGSASNVVWTGTKIDNSNYGHYIKINGETQASNKYYASLDYQSYTWDAAYWATNTPTASKADDADGTATYTFLGWTTQKDHPDNLSAGITKNDIEYPVDDNGKITKDITAKESADEAKDCPGGNGDTHTVTLYPVFKKNIFHVYKLNYDVNAPSTAEGVITRLYTNNIGSNTSTNWKEYQVIPDPTTMNPKPDPMPEKGDPQGNLYTETEQLSKTNYEWDLSGKGFFATCINTGKTPTGDMKLIGWSNKKFKMGEYDTEDPPKDGEGRIDTSIKFYPVTSPADPSAPAGEGVFAANTVVKIDVDEQDQKPGDACTEDKGKVHTETLYAVWEGEPIHQYSVIFAGNSNHPQQNDVEVLYGNKAKWDEYAADSSKKPDASKATIAKTYKDGDSNDVQVKYYDGTTEVALTEDVKNTYRVFSGALPLKDTGNDTSTFQFKPEFWKDNSDPEDVKDLIVKAERKASADTRYIFKGWNTKPDGSGTNIAVDSDGYITDTIEIKDTDYDNCDSYTHNVILYAQWEEVKIHNFQVIFCGEGANAFGYYDGNSWKQMSTPYIYKNNIKDFLVDQEKVDQMPSGFYSYTVDSGKVDTTKTSYAWGGLTGDKDAIKLMARKNSDAISEYEFLGWSVDKKTPITTLTADDAEYQVGDEGTFNKQVEIEEPDSVCSKATHAIVLYPVFKRIPTHNFSVTLNVNGGNGLRVYNASAGTWYNSTTYTYYKPESTNTKKKVTETEDSYTWGASDFWSKFGAGAYRNYDSYFTYELVGWSTKQKQPAINPDTTNDMVSWNKSGETEYASSDTNKMNPIVNGFIDQDITVTHTSNLETGLCNDNGSHNVTLYAVWKKTPRTKTYTLNFNANGGVNAPDPITQTTTYDEGNSGAWNSSNFTLTNAQIAASGMKNKKMVFVGWHENERSDSGKYGEQIHTNAEIENLTQSLTNPYVISNTATSTSLPAYTTEKTLYAIWWYEFELRYYANGGSGAPEHEHAYVKNPNFEFEISKDIPTHASGYTFLGWSENQITPGEGTEADVQVKASPQSGPKVDWNVPAAGDPKSDDYGYTEKKLYAVWGPAN